ncbi:mediator of RNA polymerase II transcription subunit 28-like [Artemia franciscana]|uniref:Mediator of RNA polymerase II transcription subunit 28 n=1 Tax=Artemia franciscana TaxID=6661 RepID=A0AA88KVZ9_ARTSF|nr:hypothetical protein QYM36_013041 [Artemia franciscana]
MSSSSSSLAIDFDEAFQGVLNILSCDDTSPPRCDKEELKHHAEQSVIHFIDCAKKLEIYFFQKRFQISLTKPERILREDITEMRQEIERKDHLLKKHYERVSNWQARLSDGTPGQQGPSQQLVAPQQSPLSQQVQRPSIPIQPGMNQLPMQGGVNPQFVSGIPQPVQVGMSPGGPQMQPGYGNMQGTMNRMPHPGMQGANTGLQGPLAYLEKTTSNIGMGR